MSGLSDQQRERMERNRLDAIRRKQERGETFDRNVSQLTTPLPLALASSPSLPYSSLSSSSAAAPSPRLFTSNSSSSSQATSRLHRTSSSWGPLRPPSAKDIAGPRRVAKGLSSDPCPPYTHLVVLDFEWTCDNTKAMIKPCSEITQFPSVLVRLAGRESVACDEFDTFVRPRFNPLLSSFASELTGISQSQVDGAPLLEDAMRRYLAWLESHDLIEFGQQQSDNNDKDDDGKLRIDGLRGGSDKRKEEEEATTDTVRLADAAVAPPATPTPHEQQRCRHGNGKADARDLLFLRHRKVGHWSIATWSDADIGGQLSRELKAKSLPIPTCFDSWVDLKKCFARHYRREPKGGLKTCVESLGLCFEGRAHNGLMDSRNTASIVLHMARGASSEHGPAFVFRRATVT